MIVLGFLYQISDRFENDYGYFTAPNFLILFQFN